jgi:hypothetical protein
MLSYLYFCVRLFRPTTPLSPTRANLVA